MARRFPRTRHGFSMIEMMITVTILGIIGALAAPMLRPNHTAKLRAAASILAADIDACRAESIAHSEDPRLIVFDVANNTYRLVASSDTDTPLTNAANSAPYLVEFGANDTSQLNGVIFQAAHVGGDDRLGFGIYGQLDQANNAMIVLGSGGAYIPLFIDAPTGEVTIGDLTTNSNGS